MIKKDIKMLQQSSSRRRVGKGPISFICICTLVGCFQCFLQYLHSCLILSKKKDMNSNAPLGIRTRVLAVQLHR